MLKSYTARRSRRGEKMKRIGLWQYVLRVLCGTGLALLVFSNTANAEENERGKQLFEMCSQCHGLQGEGMALSLAPSIAGLELWSLEAQLRKFRDGARGVHHEDIAGMRMRPMSMWLKTDEDLVAVANVQWVGFWFAIIHVGEHQ